MIIFYTVLTNKSGMGNYIRTRQIYNQVKETIEAQLFVQTDDIKLKKINDKEIHGPKHLIRKDVFGIVKSGSCYLVSDFPSIDGEDLDIHSHRNILLTFSLNDSTVSLINPDYYFNTDDLIIPSPQTKSFVGFQYQIIRDEVLNLERKKPSRVIQKIGVMFGGSDPGNLTEQFISLIKNCTGLNKFHFLILVGEKFSQHRVKKLKESNCCFNVSFLFSSDLIKFYNEIDCLINMGGMSTYEALYLGINVCSVEWEYMTPYVRIQNKRLGTSNLGAISDSANNLSKLLNLFKTNSNNVVTRKIIDGLGSKRISKIIMEVCG